MEMKNKNDQSGSSNGTFADFIPNTLMLTGSRCGPIATGVCSIMTEWGVNAQQQRIVRTQICCLLTTGSVYYKQLKVGIFIKFTADKAASCCRLRPWMCHLCPYSAFAGYCNVFTTWVRNRQRAQSGVCWRQAEQSGDFCVAFVQDRNSKAAIKD